MQGKYTVERKAAKRNDTFRILLIAISVIVQTLWFLLAFIKLGTNYTWVSILVSVLSIFMVLFIYGKHLNAAMKMPWLILILSFPMLGVPLYAMVGWNRSTRKMRTRFTEADSQLFPLLQKGDDTYRELKARDTGASNISIYLSRLGFPVYGNTAVTYYDDGKKGFDAQLKDLEKAEKFLFLEYHAIEDGESFAPMKELLIKKAAEGVDVRVIYDEIGSAGFINSSFARMMEEKGVKCRVFNPLSLIVNLFMNNRDHRKITVVDGVVGYTGGYNLADEYFHFTSPYGYWKDTGIRLEGDGVSTLTALFLEMWNAMKDSDKDVTDFSQYFRGTAVRDGEGCFIQPYADSPIDDIHVGEEMYMNVLNYASSYAYFITPYLIITDEMKKSFELAAKRGVDVRLITPGIPDKKLVYSITRSYYAGLAMAGVRIYEFTPGFCHCKQCVADDSIAICGTINLDYRSLYHHFENGAVIYGGAPVMDMKADFDSLFPQCREVTAEYASGRNTVLRIGQCLLRLVSPLM